MGMWTPEVKGSLLSGHALFYDAQVVDMERTGVADDC